MLLSSAARFSGTSSVTAIVAGVVASLQGTRRAAGMAPIEPIELRRLLTETGTPLASTEHYIGTQPFLPRALERALGHPLPTPMPDPGKCIGDCNRDSSVAIGDLVDLTSGITS